MMKPGSLKILYIGPIRRGSTTKQRMIALQDLGHKLTKVNTHPEWVVRKEWRLHNRIIRRLFGPMDLASTNEAIINHLEKEQFDLLWIDKGLTIEPDTFKAVGSLQDKCLIVGYSPDDMTGNKRNQSRRFLRSLRYYDIYFTTKSYCVSELEELGCRRSEFIGNAYDRSSHHPVEVTTEERERFGGPVGFIGQWEPERAKSLYFLADCGIDVRVWGYTWHRCKRHCERLRLENRPLLAEDYARAICAFDINLGFLRKANRDLQTTRSMEIPACGGFMLAERTDEHLSLFKEGKEAEFFSSDEELLDKVKYYLCHDEERKGIAQAGRQRCLDSGYSNHERLREAINKIVALRSK